MTTKNLSDYSKEELQIGYNILGSLITTEEEYQREIRKNDPDHPEGCDCCHNLKEYVSSIQYLREIVYNTIHY